MHIVFLNGHKKIFLLFLYIGTFWPLYFFWPVIYWSRNIFILFRLDGLFEGFMVLLVHEYIQDEVGLTILLLIELFDDLVQV